MKTRKSIFLSLLVGLMILALTGTAYAQDYYVSTTGDDSNNGLSLDDAWKTIDYAVDNAGDGCVIYVKGGTYTGGVTISNPGIPDNHKTLSRYKTEVPVIRRDNIHNHGITVSTNYWIIDGFEITNTWHPIRVLNGRHDIIMKNLNCHRNGYSLVLNDGSYNMTIENSKFHHPHSASTNFIGLRGEDDHVSHHITIKDCEFRGCGHNSINFYTSQSNEHYDGTKDVLIEGCSFTEDRQVCIFTNWMGVTNMTVRDCYFYHCSRGIQAVMKDCLIENCVVEDHGHHFVYSQADDYSHNVTVRDINAHAGTWGTPNPCINLFKGHDFFVYNVTATGDFSRTSTPAQIPDPRPDQTPTPNQTATATPGPMVEHDNRLKQATPDKVLGSSPWLDVGRLGDNNYNSVLWFDLPNETVESATLSLFWYYESRDIYTEVELYRPATWNPVYTTWNSCDDGLNWLSPGGDYYELYDTVSLTGSPDNQYYSFDVTELVNSYIDETYDNTGFLLKTNDNDGYIAFYSLDHYNADQRPKLTFESIPETPTENPTATPDPTPDPFDCQSIVIMHSVILNHYDVTYDGLINDVEVQMAFSDNLNGKLSDIDMKIVGDAWKNNCRFVPVLPPVEHVRWDVNKDCVVDMLDLDIVASHYNETIN